MPDEKKKQVRVVVGGESSRHLDASGGTPDPGVPLSNQFPPDLTLFVRLLWVKRREGDWKTSAPRLTMSQKSSLLVDLCRLLVGANQMASPLKEQLGELVLIQR